MFSTILLIISLICLGLATIEVQAKINLGWLGVFCFVLSVLVGKL